MTGTVAQQRRGGLDDIGAYRRRVFRIVRWAGVGCPASSSSVTSTCRSERSNPVIVRSQWMSRRTIPRCAAMPSSQIVAVKGDGRRLTDDPRRGEERP